MPGAILIFNAWLVTGLFWSSVLCEASQELAAALMPTGGADADR